MLHSTCVICSG